MGSEKNEYKRTILEVINIIKNLQLINFKTDKNGMWPHVTIALFVITRILTLFLARFVGRVSLVIHRILISVNF